MEPGQQKYDKRRVLLITYKDPADEERHITVRVIPSAEAGMIFLPESSTRPKRGWYMQTYDLDARDFLSIPVVDIIGIWESPEESA